MTFKRLILRIEDTSDVMIVFRLSVVAMGSMLCELTYVLTVSIPMIQYPSTSPVTFHILGNAYSILQATAVLAQILKVTPK